MKVDWKCDNCQDTYDKLIAPFMGYSEKYCLPCFAFGMGLATAKKPDLEPHYNAMVKQAEKQLEQSAPQSIVFISKDGNTDKVVKWLKVFTKQK